jgi:hypothetical protein
VHLPEYAFDPQELAYLSTPNLHLDEGTTYDILQAEELMILVGETVVIPV